MYAELGLSPVHAEGHVHKVAFGDSVINLIAVPGRRGAG